MKNPTLIWIAMLARFTVLLLTGRARAQEPPDGVHFDADGVPYADGEAPYVYDCTKMGVFTKQIALARDDGTPQREVVDGIYANRDDYPPSFKRSGRTRAEIAKMVRDIYTNPWTARQQAGGIMALCLAQKGVVGKWGDK